MAVAGQGVFDCTRVAGLFFCHLVIYLQSTHQQTRHACSIFVCVLLPVIPSFSALLPIRGRGPPLAILTLYLGLLSRNEQVVGCTSLLASTTSHNMCVSLH